MKLKLNLLLILLSAITLSNLNAQNDLLDSLTKVNMEELDPSKEIMIDGITIPVFSIDGKQLSQEEMMQQFMKGDVAPDFYVDNNKDIKAIVLRKATKEEMEMMGMAALSNNDSINEEAIAFTATDLEGNTFSLDELKGKVIVINFWFVACKPCVEEIPELNELVEKYEDKDVVFLGFALDNEKRLNSFLEKNPFKYHIFPESKELIGSYGVNSYPTHIVIDQSSAVVFKTSGLSPTTVKSIENTILSLIE
jgi:peroxiredoxin